MFHVGTRARISIMCLIYKKSLRLSALSRKHSTIGEMVNLISVNAQHFIEITHHANTTWIAPIQIAFCLYMLYSYLGVASLSGFATMVLFVPFNVFATNKSKQMQKNKLRHQDSRIKIMHEILNGMKVKRFDSENCGLLHKASFLFFVYFRLLNFTLGNCLFVRLYNQCV